MDERQIERGFNILSNWIFVNVLNLIKVSYFHFE